MMQCIYSRVSTGRQDTDNQLAKLKALYPNAAVFEEVASGVKQRPVLQKLVASLTAGDELIVAALDRLGRRTAEILTLIEELKGRGVVLKSLREGVDFSTPVGALVCSILVSVSQLERDLISERTKAALAVKRAKGIVGGRRPKFSSDTVAQAQKLRAEGMTVRQVAQVTGVSASRVYQLCKAKTNAA